MALRLWVTSPFLFRGIRSRRSGRTMELGRWTAISYGVIDNRSENLQHCQWVTRAVQVAAAGHLRPVRYAVPFRQRAVAAASGTEARGCLSQRSDGDDVDLYRRRTSGHAADRTPGRVQGRHLGAKAALSCRVAILPIRAVLYTLSDNSVWLIGVQVLDGVGAGIFGALAPLVIADIMRGTGRYNLAQGAIATVQGIGASLSGLAAGEIVDHFGYSAAFLSLGAAALVAVIVFFLQMPETAEPETTKQQTVSPKA